MNYILNQHAAQDDWTLIRLSEGETPESVTVPAGQHIVKPRAKILGSFVR